MNRLFRLVYWRLNVTATAPGIDDKAVFDMPVQHKKG